MRRFFHLTAALLLCLTLISCTPAAPVSQKPDPTPRPPLLIYLDAGHGAHDPGAMSPDGRMEKDDVLRLTLAVRDLLLAEGIDVRITREDDTYLELIDRCTLANEAGATHFVSFHRNSGGASGVEIWINLFPTDEAVFMANAILEALDSVGIARNRGVKRGTASGNGSDYAMNNGTRMPSCLVELGFMDSEEDNRLFDEHFESYARAISDGILSLQSP